MKYEQAKRLLSVDIGALPLEKVQKHKVKLIDAWRESMAEYGMPQAVRDGFYIRVLCDQATGYAPRDIFLTHNLLDAFQMAAEREAKILGEGGEGCGPL